MNKNHMASIIEMISMKAHDHLDYKIMWWRTKFKKVRKASRQMVLGFY